MAIDPVKAIDLVKQMESAANGLSSDAQALAAPLADASSLLRSDVGDAPSGLRHIAAELRDSSADLRERARIVLAGGPELNAGLAALERIRAHFGFIETRGDMTPSDGILSRQDLRWARIHADSETADAAAWLLDHDQFFDKVETAFHNDEYLDGLLANEFTFDADDRDARMSLDDIDAFLEKTSAWSAVLPHVDEIDTAFLGGQSDGFLSREDFQTFLMHHDPSPETAAAVTRILDDGAYHRPDSMLGLGTLLDALSFLPVIGDVVDGGRSIYYAIHGDFATAGLFALAIVPLPGVSTTGIRGAIKVVDTVASVARKSGTKAAVREAGSIAVKGSAANFAAYTTTSKAADVIDSQVGLDKSVDYVIDEGIEGIENLLGEELDPMTKRQIHGGLKSTLNNHIGQDARNFLTDANEVISRRYAEHQANQFAFRARPPR